MKRFILVAVLALLGGSFAHGQDSKVEATVDYSYFRFNPTLSSHFNSQNLNGGGGDVTFFFSGYVGIKADLQGYASDTQCTKAGAPITGCASANLFTYTFGPEFKYHGEGRFEPFGEVLVGGTHSNFYANACKQGGICGSASPSNNAFALVVGGGVDVKATSRLSLRLVDADYVLTTFDNHLNGSGTQSNFRFTTGIQFRF